MCFGGIVRNPENPEETHTNTGAAHDSLMILSKLSNFHYYLLEGRDKELHEIHPSFFTLQQIYHGTQKEYENLAIQSRG